MIVAVLFAIGFAIGWMRASRRGGGTADKLQFALAHGIPLALIGLAGVILAARMGWYI